MLHAEGLPSIRDFQTDVADRENWQSGEENRKRGTDWLMEIYRHNDAKTKDRMAAHKDFREQQPFHSDVGTLSLITSLRLAVHRNHIRPLPLRPHHSRQSRYAARSAVGHNDPESGA